MNNAAAITPSNIISATETALIKCSLNGHVRRRLLGGPNMPASLVTALLLDCIESCHSTLAHCYSGRLRGRARESYVMKDATVNTQFKLLRKTPGVIL